MWFGFDGTLCKEGIGNMQHKFCSIKNKSILVIVVAVAWLNIMGDPHVTHAVSSRSVNMAAERANASDSPALYAVEEDVIGTLADGYIAIVNSTFLTDRAVEWNLDHLHIAKQVYEDALVNSDYGYASTRKGFGSLSRWAQAMGITQAPEECRSGCKFAGGAIRLVYNPAFNGDMATWHITALGRFPVITVGGANGYTTDPQFAIHELAHIWDGAHGWGLGTAMDLAMQVKRDINGSVVFDETFEALLAKHGDFATGYFNPAHPGNPHGCEHFADTVMAYFLFDAPGYAKLFHAYWADEDPRCDAKFEYDRYDFVRDMIRFTHSERSRDN